MASFLGLLALAGCGAPERPSTARSRNFRPVSDVPVKVGRPYQAGGRTWVPRDDPDYDETGDASWYGTEHAGRPTANGERFDPDAVSAAHPTLPLPSYVAVTLLASRRTIIVRVNDRGPFTTSRILDLSRGAARQLGTLRQGIARVRVRRVYPEESVRRTLRAGQPAHPLVADTWGPGRRVRGASPALAQLQARRYQIVPAAPDMTSRP